MYSLKLVGTRAALEGNFADMYAADFKARNWGVFSSSDARGNPSESCCLRRAFC